MSDENGFADLEGFIDEMNARVELGEITAMNAGESFYIICDDTLEGQGMLQSVYVAKPKKEGLPKVPPMIFLRGSPKMVALFASSLVSLVEEHLSSKRPSSQISFAQMIGNIFKKPKASPEAD